MPFYEHAQAQTLIQLAHQNQTTVGGHPSALEIDLQRAVEGELKGPILCLTHRHSTSSPAPIPSKPTSFNGSASSYHISEYTSKMEIRVNFIKEMAERQ